MKYYAYIIVFLQTSMNLRSHVWSLHDITFLVIKIYIYIFFLNFFLSSSIWDATDEQLDKFCYNLWCLFRAFLCHLARNISALCGCEISTTPLSTARWKGKREDNSSCPILLYCYTFVSQLYLAFCQTITKQYTSNTCFPPKRNCMNGLKGSRFMVNLNMQKDDSKFTWITYDYHGVISHYKLLYNTCTNCIWQRNGKGNVKIECNL